MRESGEENFIRVWSGHFPKEFCDKLISRFEQIVNDPELKNHVYDNEKQFSTRALGRKDIAVFLQDSIFDSNDLVAEHLDRLHECFMEYYETFGQISHLRLDNRRIIKVQRTEPMGGYHQFHYENGDVGMWDRELTWMVYLNDMPSGEAETEFLFQKLRIRPTAGTVVIWPAGMTHVHRGNTVFTHNKYITTGWYHKIDGREQLNDGSS
jgi:hypothetical protein